MEAEPLDAREQWEAEQAQRAAFAWFGADPPAAASSAEPQREGAPAFTGDIALDTNGELVPRYEYVALEAAQLVSGDLLVTRRFGVVRLTAVVPLHGEQPATHERVQLRWLDQTGGQSAAAAVAAVHAVTLRVPDRQDGARITRGIDRSYYFSAGLDHSTARLIAAHLQLGPRSGLYRLAIDGALVPSTLPELEVVLQSQRPYVSRWSRALAGYCRLRRSPNRLPWLDKPP